MARSRRRRGVGTGTATGRRGGEGMRSTRLLRVAMVGVALVMATAWLPGTPAGALPTAPVITGYPDAAVGTPNAAFSFHAPEADGYQCRTFTTGTAEGSRPAFAACSGGSAGTHVVTGRTDGVVDLRGAGHRRGRPRTVDHPRLDRDLRPRGAVDLRADRHLHLALRHRDLHRRGSDLRSVQPRRRVVRDLRVRGERLLDVARAGRRTAHPPGAGHRRRRVRARSPPRPSPSTASCR